MNLTGEHPRWAAAAWGGRSVREGAFYPAGGTPFRVTASRDGGVHRDRQGGKDFIHANEPFIRAMISAAWISLFIAGCMETGWVVGLKYSEGFSRLVPSVATVALMAGSFYFLSQSIKDLPLGTAYAVWTGIGALGAVIIGMAAFGESRDIARIMCLFLIIGGIIGLKLVTLD